MLTLYDDIFIKISELLEQHEKIMLTMASVSLNRLKYVFRYYEKINIDKIIHLSYFDNFECVKLTPRNHTIVPKSVKHVYLKTCDSNIPPFVTHLLFYGLIRTIMPASVTHLAFGDFFDQSVIGCLSSVIYLEINLTVISMILCQRHLNI